MSEVVRLSRISLAVAVALGATVPVRAADQPAEVAEVVVTGSYIQRSEGFTPASPVDTVSGAQIASQAPKAISDFLTTLPYNVNSSFQTGRVFGTTSGAGTANLRNLGDGATLVLLDSRRTAKDGINSRFVDVNSLTPSIMIERVEVLKDGASALYGSDAVGGVLNFITKKKFDGFQTDAQVNVRDIGTTADYRVGALWGAQTEKTSIVAALEYFHRDPYLYDTLGFVQETGRQFLVGGWPAAFGVPNRNAAGTIAGAATALADPLCGQIYPSVLVTGATVTRFAGTAAAQTFPAAAACRMNLATGNEAQASEERYLAALNIRHEFSEQVNFFGKINYTYQQNQIADHSTGGVPTTPALIVPGYAPGNTFRARNAAGVALFAQSSGVQLGYDKDGDGIREFIPLRNATGVVQLNAGPDGVVGTADDATGGVPFWEDVSVAAGSRVFSVQCGLPSGLQDRSNCRQKYGQLSFNENNIGRMVGGFDGQITENWRYETAFTFARNDEDNSGTGNTTAYLANNLRQALAGLGGAGCNANSLDPLTAGNSRPGTGNCKFYNIFGNAITAVPGSLLANDLNTVLYFNPIFHDAYRTQTKVVDAVISGTLFNLPAGPLGVAFGVQHRNEGWAVDYDQAFNNAATETGITFVDNDRTQFVNAVFAEVNVPLLASETAGNLELSGAVRHENTAGPGLESTDPKVGLMYSTPGRSVKLRGTWSTSFLAPTLVQRFERSGQFTNTVDDGATTAIENLTRVTVARSGAEALDPQESTAFNLGTTIEPIEDLKLDVDYWSYEFDGLITAENAIAVARDFARDPTKVVRDTTAGTVVDSQTGQTIGQIVRINTTYINAAQVKTSGLDFGIGHKFDLNGFGTLRNNLMATYLLKYDLQTVVGGPIVDAKGNRNATRAAAPGATPEWRATLRTNWELGSNAVQALVRYTDGYTNDSTTLGKPQIPSFVTLDLSYTYNLASSLWGMNGASLSVGSNNILDRNPPVVPDGNGTLPFLYDYSGRNIWARVSAKF